MNIELLKKLKESGFPQEGINSVWIDYTEKELGEHYDFLADGSSPTGETVLNPSIEELVKACGFQHFELRIREALAKYWLDISL